MKGPQLRSRLMPRHVIVCTLNNKSVIYAKSKRTKEARSSLKRALQMAQRDLKTHEAKERISALKQDSRGDLSSIIDDSLFTNDASNALASEDRFGGRHDYEEGLDYYANLHQLKTSCVPSSKKDNSNPLFLKARNKATILYNMGRIEHDECNYGDAFTLYRKSMALLQSFSSLQADGKLILAVLFAMGHIRCLHGDYLRALKYYMAALSTSNIIFGSESLETAASLNCIGVVQYSMQLRDPSIALEALETSLKIRQEKLGNSHLEVATTWNNIGRIVFQQERYDDALEAYDHTLRIRAEEDAESIDTAATYFNIAQVHHHRGEHEKALPLYKEFLRLLKLKVGEYHRDTCIVTTCIGDVLHGMKDYDRALKCLNHALRIGKVVFGPVHPEIAITLNKIGNLYYETNDLNSALLAYKHGLKIELEALEEGNPNIAVTYANTAEICKQQTLYDEALYYYQALLKFQKRNKVGQEAQSVTMNHIASLYQEKGDYEKALEISQECLMLRKQLKGDSDSSVASLLTQIALVLLKIEKYDIAVGALMEAYRIRKTLQSKDEREIAYTMYNIALIYHHQGSHDMALLYYRETARLEEGMVGDDNRDLAVTFFNIGQIYYQKGDLQLAVKNLEKALRIEQRCYGANHPSCARTLNEIGNMELQGGNLEAMMNAYARALLIFRGAGMDDDNLVIIGVDLWRFSMIQPAVAAAA